MLNVSIILFERSKIVPLHAMKTCSGRRGTTPLILNLGATWRWVANFTHRPLYPWERTPILFISEALYSPSIVVDQDYCLQGSTPSSRIETYTRFGGPFCQHLLPWR